MNWKSSSSSSSCVVFFLFHLALMLSHSTTAVAKSRYPISDEEIRLKKDQCYADVQSGLWGWDCKTSMISRENCALQCLSPRCYELIYEGDPLEEGEKDTVRRQEYKYCMQRLSTGESIEGIKGSFNY